MLDVKYGHGLLGLRTLKSAKNEMMKGADFLHADTNLGKLKVTLIIMRRDLIDHWTLKSCVFHKWFDELSRVIECFLCTDSDGIIFVLTANLLCIFDI